MPLTPPPQRATANIAQGALRGFVGERGELNFRGIPYAKPPTGQLRWQPPLPHPGWGGEVLDATAWGNTCLNLCRGCEWSTVENTGSSSEDCLYLNVVAPARARGTGPFPVAVYLHAGQFEFGASSDRESDFPFFAEDVILVSPNSRLGVFGFLASDDLATLRPHGWADGHYGLLDQQLAMRWVQQNIGAFGGDARRVTIWGESSGGTSVAAHLVLPSSWGLFHRAILQSPGLTQVKSREDAQLNYRYVLSALLARGSAGCRRAAGFTEFAGVTLLATSNRSALSRSADWTVGYAEALCDARPECFGFDRAPNADGSTTTTLHSSAEVRDVRDRSPAGSPLLPSTHLKAAQVGEAGVACVLGANGTVLGQLTLENVRGDSFETDAWAPVLPGAVPSIVERIARGASAPGVDVLIGSNLDEGTEFMELTPPIGCDASAADFGTWADAFYGHTLGHAVARAYREPMRPWPLCRPHARAGAATAPSQPGAQWYTSAQRAAGDSAFTCRVRSAAASWSSRQQRVFRYFFTQQPQGSLNMGDVLAMGAFHGAEVPFVFGDAFELSGEGERALSAAMGCYWRRFIHSGDPNLDPHAFGPCARGASPPAWPPFNGTSDAEELTLVLDTARIAPTRALKRELCRLFSQEGEKASALTVAAPARPDRAVPPTQSARPLHAA